MQHPVSRIHTFLKLEERVRREDLRNEWLQEHAEGEGVGIVAWIDIDWFKILYPNMEATAKKYLRQQA